MIKIYRNQKIVQLTIGILWLIGIYLFVDSDIIRIGMLTSILFMGIAYNAKLLTNIKKNDGIYIFETYSVITQKEEFKISESQLTDILYNQNSLFKSHNLTFNFKGTNGTVSKKLYLNTEPWSDLTAELNRMKKTIGNTT